MWFIYTLQCAHSIIILISLHPISHVGAIQDGDSPHDTLFVGTQSNLVAYDVERNAELFFKDIQDGVNALHVGKMSNLSAPVVIVGGNCSILGFDKEGSEVFWTVTGDNVSALTMSDVPSAKGTAKKELLVGSDDFEIRVFQNEDLVGEVTEADRITHLCPMDDCKFAYGLANGTVGVYNAGKQRVWRVKAKNNVTALQTYDLDLDGVKEVVSGWSNGSFNVRREHTGEIIFKDAMKSSVSGIVRSDYRMDGKETLMIVAESGDVKAYLATDLDLTLATDTPGPSVTASSGEQRALAELHQKKQQLIGDLRTLEKSLKAQKTGETTLGSLPADTALQYTLSADAEAGTVIVHVSASTDIHLHTILAFDTEGAFLAGNEVVVAIPSSASRAGSISLTPSRSVACSLKVQAHVSLRGHSELLHVFEKEVKIPHFASFQNMPDKASCPQPSSEVRFEVSSKIGKVEEWIRASFLIDADIKLHHADQLRVFFVSIFDVTRHGQQVTGQRSALFITAASAGNMTEIVFKLDGMELAGDLLQDLGKFLGITELDSLSKFPEEMSDLTQLVGEVAEYNNSRNRLQADMADDSQRVKALVVRAEDSRLMVDMDTMRRAYTELYGLNNQLIAGYSTRAANHEGLMAGLKQINQV
jgi:Bardet-Biedl syndrome 2 protein